MLPIEIVSQKQADLVWSGLVFGIDTDCEVRKKPREFALVQMTERCWQGILKIDFEAGTRREHRAETGPGEILGFELGDGDFHGIRLSDLRRG